MGVGGLLNKTNPDLMSISTSERGTAVPPQGTTCIICSAQGKNFCLAKHHNPIRAVGSELEQWEYLADPENPEEVERELESRSPPPE